MDEEESVNGNVEVGEGSGVKVDVTVEVAESPFCRERLVLRL